MLKHYKKQKIVVLFPDRLLMTGTTFLVSLDCDVHISLFNLSTVFIPASTLTGRFSCSACLYVGLCALARNKSIPDNKVSQYYSGYNYLDNTQSTVASARTLY
jgi:hypothetical protein